MGVSEPPLLQQRKVICRVLHLITSIRRKMRNYLMPLADKVRRRKRFVIETVLDTLKSEMGLEHSPHRSVINAMVHVRPASSLTPSDPASPPFHCQHKKSRLIHSWG